MGGASRVFVLAAVSAVVLSVLMAHPASAVPASFARSLVALGESDPRVAALLQRLVASAQGASPSSRFDAPTSGRAIPDLCVPAVSVGYPCEHHTVVTEDGFELGQIRLPAKTGAYPVFLQHGLLDSGITWMFNADPSENLAFILHDAGYDVWIGNSRGNTYSMPNKKLSGKAYWEAIDYDGMAKYDLPANVHYVLNATGHASLSYVGHSQGTIQAFAAFSTVARDIVPLVDVFAALAPVAYVGNQTSFVLKLLADLPVAQLLDLFGEKEFLPNTFLLHAISEFCRIGHKECPDLLWVIVGGGNISNVDGERFPFLTKYDPGGTSVNNMVHWVQGATRSKFQMHDYGEKKNIEKYGQATPPQYHLGNMTGPPTALFWGSDDDLADPKDVKRIVAEVPASTIIKNKNIPIYGHMDFVWGQNANDFVYNDLVALLPKP